MLGVTGHVQAFEVGEHLDQSSRVQAVVDYFGPTDFLQMDAHRPPGGVVPGGPAADRLTAAQDLHGSPPRRLGARGHAGGPHPRHGGHGARLPALRRLLLAASAADNQSDVERGLAIHELHVPGAPLLESATHEARRRHVKAVASQQPSEIEKLLTSRRCVERRTSPAFGQPFGKFILEFQWICSLFKENVSVEIIPSPGSPALII